MKKTYIGSPKLHFNFKMFRVKYQNSLEADKIKEQISDRINKYL